MEYWSSGLIGGTNTRVCVQTSDLLFGMQSLLYAVIAIGLNMVTENRTFGETTSRHVRQKQAPTG